jgi:hypothetical protein
MMGCFERIRSYLVVDVQLLNMFAEDKPLVVPCMVLVEHYEVVGRMSLAVVQYP